MMVHPLMIGLERQVAFRAECPGIKQPLGAHDEFVEAKAGIIL